MKNLCLLSLITCMLAGSLCAYDVVVPSDMSCRTEGGSNADVNRHDSQKLSVRRSSDTSGNKSWIKFDQLGDYDLSTLRGAVLTVALHNPKSGSQQCDVSAVNDDVTGNILWVDHPTAENPANDIYALTWNNAPGNLTTHWGNLDAAETEYVETITFTDGLAGDAFDIDVLEILQADTDGIVQFVLHNSQNLLDFATADHPTVEWRPYLTLSLPPLGADYPMPADGAVTDNTLPALSWTNPDPNDGVSPITCDVYLGTDPNRANMDRVTLDPGDNSVAVNTDNFQTYGSLVNNTWYYWVVDCDDPSDGMIPGEMWSFYVGQAPAVDAGPDQALWLDPDVTVNLDGTTSDDNPYTVLWTQVANEAPAVTITNSTSDDATVTITERGDYEFMLTADDGTLISSDTVRVVVGDDACDASHIQTGEPYNPADANEDCLVDLQDFIDLIAADWLNCTDTLTNCN